MAENKQNKRPNVPPLRFPEFTEPWGRYKVSDILDFYSTNSLSWEQLEFTDGDLRNLHYGMIHVGLPTLLNLKESKLPTIKEGNEPKSYTLCINGDVAFADASEDTNDVARAIELVETDGQKVVFGLHTIHGRDNKGLTEVGFKGYLFSSRVFHDQIKRIAQGTKVFSISNKNFSECFVGIPSKAEQTKIARLLSLLDRRIAVQSKLIEDLKQLKSALTNKFIEKLVATCILMPFSDIYETAGEGGTPDTTKSEYYERGTIPFIKIDDLSNKYLQENKDFITELGLKKSSAWVVPKQSVIFSNGATIGAISINTYDVTTKQGILGIVPKATVDVEFLYYLMTSTYFTKQIHRIITHGTMATAYLKDINKIKVPLPIIKEQKRIVKILSSISRKQEIEEQILNQLKIQKQYLLGQMFI